VGPTPLSKQASSAGCPAHGMRTCQPGCLSEVSLHMPCTGQPALKANAVALYAPTPRQLVHKLFRLHCTRTCSVTVWTTTEQICCHEHEAPGTLGPWLSRWVNSYQATRCAKAATRSASLRFHRPSRPIGIQGLDMFACGYCETCSNPCM
jgi:hypothetical protein